MNKQARKDHEAKVAVEVEATIELVARARDVLQTGYKSAVLINCPSQITILEEMGNLNQSRERLQNLANILNARGKTG